VSWLNSKCPPSPHLPPAFFRLPPSGPGVGEIFIEADKRLGTSRLTFVFFKSLFAEVIYRPLFSGFGGGAKACLMGFCVISFESLLPGADLKTLLKGSEDFEVARLLLGK